MVSFTPDMVLKLNGLRFVSPRPRQSQQGAAVLVHALLGMARSEEIRPEAYGLMGLLKSLNRTPIRGLDG